LKQSKYEA